jgi:hypothetical protein
MFRIIAEPRAWWPVTFPGVTEDGEVVENRFEMRFLLHGEDEHAQLSSKIALLPARAEQLAVQGFGHDATPEAVGERKLTILSRLYTEVVREIAADWRLVGAENGDPLKFEDENIRQLMNLPGVFRATFEAYRSCRLGGKDAREGN